MYEYKARILRVIDGDTVACRVDLGCDSRIDLTVRLFGINAPEMSTEEGKAAKQWLVDQLDRCQSVVTLQTIKDKREKYGRYLGILYADIEGSRIHLNQEIIDVGHASKY